MPDAKKVLGLRVGITPLCETVQNAQGGFQHEARVVEAYGPSKQTTHAHVVHVQGPTQILGT